MSGMPEYKIPSSVPIAKEEIGKTMKKNLKKTSIKEDKKEFELICFLLGVLTFATVVIFLLAHTIQSQKSFISDHYIVPRGYSGVWVDLNRTQPTIIVVDPRDPQQQAFVTEFDKYLRSKR